jgi:hypothetical protein
VISQNLSLLFIHASEGKLDHLACTLSSVHVRFLLLKVDFDLGHPEVLVLGLLRFVADAHAADDRTVQERGRSWNIKNTCDLTVLLDNSEICNAA